MSYDIQLATLKHSDEIISLTQALGYDANQEETASWLKELINSPCHAAFVAICENKVSAWLVVEKRLFLESGFKVEITGLVVGLNYRRNGIAEALVFAAERWAIEQGLQKIVVRSNVSRQESHLFYPAVGFTRSKTSHVYVKHLEKS